jgi:hypothetical protein
LCVIITVILKVLQLFVVTTSEDPLNRFTNPNPRRSQTRDNIYNAEQIISSFSNLKFHVLFILVSMVTHAPSPWFVCHGDGSTEGGVRSVAHEVEIRYTCSA